MNKDIVSIKEYKNTIQDLKDVMQEYVHKQDAMFKKVWGEATGWRCVLGTVCYFFLITWGLHFIIAKQVTANVAIIPTGFAFIAIGCVLFWLATKVKIGVYQQIIAISCMVCFWASFEYFQAAGILSKGYKCKHYYIRQMLKEEKLDPTLKGMINQYIEDLKNGTR